MSGRIFKCLNCKKETNYWSSTLTLNMTEDINGKYYTCEYCDTKHTYVGYEDHEFDGSYLLELFEYNGRISYNISPNNIIYERKYLKCLKERLNSITYP